MSQEFDRPFEDEPRRNVFVTGTINDLGRLKSTFLRSSKTSRARNLIFVQNWKRLVSAGDNRRHLMANLRPAPANADFPRPGDISETGQ